MTVEVADYVGQLDQSLPTDDNDFVFEGDDHFRLVKKCLVQSFSAVLGAVTVTHTEMNALSGIQGNIESRLTALEGGGFPSGTVMLFIQATAPPGWTVSPTHDDRIIRVNGTTGAGTGGSWTISGLSGDGHVLTVAEMPAHSHQNNMVDSGVVTENAPNQKVYEPGTGGNDTESRGGNLPHSHTVSSNGTWRPLYVDAIVCTKN